MIPGQRTELDRFTPDERRELYKSNPALFDKLAAEAIKEACISETPEETRKLRQMQQMIDSQLRKARSQPERTELMEKIFYRNMFDLAHIVETMSGLIRPARGTEEIPARNPALLLVKR
jgi:hypothetical protein